MLTINIYSLQDKQWTISLICDIRYCRQCNIVHNCMKQAVTRTKKKAWRRKPGSSVGQDQKWKSISLGSLFTTQTNNETIPNLCTLGTQNVLRCTSDYQSSLPLLDSLEPLQGSLTREQGPTFSDGPELGFLVVSEVSELPKQSGRSKEIKSRVCLMSTKHSCCESALNEQFW